MTLRRLSWIYPDRGIWLHRDRDPSWWPGYHEAAARLGLEITVNAPPAVSIDASDAGRPQVFLEHRPVSPADTLFVTDFYAWPHQVQDVFNQLSLYAVLDRAGFYLPVSPVLSAIANDKMATMLHLADCPVPPVPTVRISAGREAELRWYESALLNSDFPMIVKPASWGAGIGVCRVNNLEDLRALVSIAGGADTPLICQPYLGDAVSDVRVYLVNGQPAGTLRRIPRSGSYVANAGRGGFKSYIDFPHELHEAVSYVAARFPMPYVCADFLYDGTRYWLSEIETDGYIACPDPGSPEAVELHQAILYARFDAYCKGHTAYRERSAQRLEV